MEWRSAESLRTRRRRDVPTRTWGRPGALARRRPRGEASLRGHLRTESKDGKEESGSSAYVPREKEKDKQLQYAIATIRGLPTDIKARKPGEKAKQQVKADIKKKDAKEVDKKDDDKSVTKSK